LCFLDEGMERDQHPVVKTEQNARFAPARQRRPDLPQATTQRTAQRQTERPSKLRLCDVAANGALVFPQPLTHGFAPFADFQKTRGIG
jgi:hypothetical protein